MGHCQDFRPRDFDTDIPFFRKPQHTATPTVESYQVTGVAKWQEQLLDWDSEVIGSHRLSGELIRAGLNDGGCHPSVRPGPERTFEVREVDGCTPGEFVGLVHEGRELAHRIQEDLGGGHEFTVLSHQFQGEPYLDFFQVHDCEARPDLISQGLDGSHEVHQGLTALNACQSYSAAEYDDSCQRPIGTNRHRSHDQISLTVGFQYHFSAGRNDHILQQPVDLHTVEIDRKWPSVLSFQDDIRRGSVFFVQGDQNDLTGENSQAVPKLGKIELVLGREGDGSP